MPPILAKFLKTISDSVKHIVYQQKPFNVDLTWFVE